MRLLLGAFLVVSMMMGCNLKEAVKETGDSIEKGASNIVDGVKQAPKAIGDAGNKIEKDIRKE